MAICSADTKSNYIIDSNDSVISGYLLIFLILKTLLDDQTAAFRHHICIVPFFFAVWPKFQWVYLPNVLPILRTHANTFLKKNILMLISSITSQWNYYANSSR